MLSLKQIEDVCLGNDTSHKRCRYFSQDGSAECQKRNKNPLDEKFPLGDNCGGYPILRHIEQGYDV